ncbi:hypothetical protein OHA72_33555 [Dactylosporangium sp. NBC_01737]|uniref:hypothetical protein n=1 Tax=Dactylosporangium sp. NBC_01737 TaxID=2975959 RepID=UPI002E10F2E9|nr:hypothetical protein OHA72_33555 [Dactylosporangium sp. NBC_01737]
MQTDGSVWDELVARFTASGLPVPPVPEVLRPALRTPQPWCWSTRDIDPMRMYLFESGFLVDVLAGRAPDYVAVSHAGHGTNSYAVNFHLVHGNLAVLMQVGWGGIYTDNAAAARRLANLWRRCEALHDPAGARRVVCVYSDIRGVSACGPAGGDVHGFLGAHHTAGEAAFDTAERLLT